jgi:hypothetical protein
MSEKVKYPETNPLHPAYKVRRPKVNIPTWVKIMASGGKSGKVDRVWLRAMGVAIAEMESKQRAALRASNRDSSGSGD